MSPKKSPPNYEDGKASMIRLDAEEQINKIRICVHVLNEQADKLRGDFNVRCNFVVTNGVVHLVVKESRTLLREPVPSDPPSE